MPSGPRLALLIALVLPATAARGGEEENWQRIRSMPRERRVILSEKLQAFDRLAPEEREAIRAIDHKLDAQAPDNKAHYRSVLRRYHLWLAALPEEQRKQVEAAPPEGRIALVSKLHASGRATVAGRSTPLSLQLAGPSPYEVARKLQPWLQLSPSERAEVEKLGLPAQQKRFLELAKQRKFRPVPRLTKAEADALLERLEADPQSKVWLQRLLDKGEVLSKKAEVLNKKGENAKGAPNPRQRLADLADNYHFIVEPPKKVDPANLLLFEASLPARFRAPFDYWAPDEARRRLTILYRLIYPHPQEISSQAGATDSKGGASPPGRVSKPATPKPARTPAQAPAAPF